MRCCRPGSTARSKGSECARSPGVVAGEPRKTRARACGVGGRPRRFARRGSAPMLRWRCPNASRKPCGAAACGRRSRRGCRPPRRWRCCWRWAWPSVRGGAAVWRASRAVASTQGWTQRCGGGPCGVCTRRAPPGGGERARRRQRASPARAGRHLSRWLTRRLSVPVKLFDLRSEGFELVGGRLLPDANGPERAVDVPGRDGPARHGVPAQGRIRRPPPRSATTAGAIWACSIGSRARAAMRWSVRSRASACWRWPWRSPSRIRGPINR